MWKEREKKEHFKMFQTERLRLIHCTFLLQWMTIFMGVYPFTSRSTVRSHPWHSNCQADEIPGSISTALSVPSQSLPRSGGEARAHSRTAAGNRAQWDPINVVTILKYHDSYDSFLVRFFFEMLFDLLFGFSWLMKWLY